MSSEIIRILLIEDNPGDARLIREMLREAGNQEMFSLEPVLTLEAGVDLAKKQSFDVILLDLSLPDSLGMETLIHMRQVAPRTAIIVLTGIDDKELGVQAVQMGAQDYLPKGDVGSRLLVRSIHYAIQRNLLETKKREQEEEYNSLINDVFNQSMVAVLIMDKSFRVVWCNKATESYFGIPRERLINRNKWELVEGDLKCIFADPDDYVARLLKSYEDEGTTQRFECHVLLNDNREERWLEHWNQPIRSGVYEGGHIGQYTDITDRKMFEFAEREQRQFNEALREIAALLTSTLDLNDVLGRILNNLGRVVPHDSASVTMLEDDYIWVARYRSMPKRDTQEITAERQLQVEYRHYLDEMFNSRQPVIVADLQDDEEVRPTAIMANVHAYVGAPIQLQNRIIGFLNLFSEKSDFFNVNHAERLSAFAELAAIAIQNARLFQHSQELAALEERNRLARDLHDSVSQTLFTCRTMAESALRRWDKDPTRARELMEEVNHLTQTALAEMRILLLELRPESFTKVSLKQLFEQYLQPIQERRQFALKMKLDDIPILSPDFQSALYRITQEALNNIDKHAKARNVEVQINNHPDLIELQIVDDGDGFVVDEVAPTSLGLSIMRERAAEIGAALKVDSKVGEGTRIKVVLNKEDGLF